MAVRFMKKLYKRNGITLVELLIVVAIIGVLATIGIPTYRKLVAKAKKAEAKIALGGIYTVENAFFTEYNSYGNNLGRMGFDMANAADPVYTIGFTKAGAECPVPDNIRPTANPGNAAVNGSFAAYFTAPIQSRYGRIPLVGSGDLCDAQDAVADGSGFTAAATGALISGVVRSAPASITAACATGTCQDIWTMNQNRVLANTVDGSF